MVNTISDCHFTLFVFIYDICAVPNKNALICQRKLSFAETNWWLPSGPWHINNSLGHFGTNLKHSKGGGDDP